MSEASGKHWKGTEHNQNSKGKTKKRSMYWRGAVMNFVSGKLTWNTQYALLYCISPREALLEHKLGGPIAGKAYLSAPARKRQDPPAWLHPLLPRRPATSEHPAATWLRPLLARQPSERRRRGGRRRRI